MWNDNSNSYHGVILGICISAHKTVVASTAATAAAADNDDDNHLKMLNYLLTCSLIAVALVVMIDGVIES